MKKVLIKKKNNKYLKNLSKVIKKWLIILKKYFSKKKKSNKQFKKWNGKKYVPYIKYKRSWGLFVRKIEKQKRTFYKKSVLRFLNTIFYRLRVYKYYFNLKGNSNLIKKNLLPMDINYSSNAFWGKKRPIFVSYTKMAKGFFFKKKTFKRKFLVSPT